MQAFAWFPLGKQWTLSQDLWNNVHAEIVFSFDVVNE